MHGHFIFGRLQAMGSQLWADWEFRTDIKDIKPVNTLALDLHILKNLKLTGPNRRIGPGASTF